MAFLFGFVCVGSWLLMFTLFADPVYRNGGELFSADNFWPDIFSCLLGASFILGAMSLILCNREVVVGGGTVKVVDVKLFKEALQEIPFGDLDSLQLLKKDGESSNAAWLYELNLIKRDMSRVNLLSHGGEKRVIEGADLLSKFSGLPIADNL